MDHHEVVLLRERLDQIQVCRAGPVLICELFAAEISSFRQRLTALLFYPSFETS
jgi:hypothetical protein